MLVVRPPVPWTRCEGMSGHVEHPQKPTSSRRLRIIDLVRPHWKTLSLAPVAVLGETFAVVLELGAARHPASRAPRRRSADLDTRGQGLRQGRLRATALRLREPGQRRGGTRGPKHQGQAVAPGGGDRRHRHVPRALVRGTACAGRPAQRRRADCLPAVSAIQAPSQCRVRHPACSCHQSNLAGKTQPLHGTAPAGVFRPWNSEETSSAHDVSPRPGETIFAVRHFSLDAFLKAPALRLATARR